MHQMIWAQYFSKNYILAVLQVELSTVHKHKPYDNINRYSARKGLTIFSLHGQIIKFRAAAKTSRYMHFMDSIHLAYNITIRK